mmetsp:Transcript_32878/g.95130  ORF Transcript_32878/g.95130 Transcript_32878/m.95130 type:complete len:339 (-) Transcript_32878:764-1780(-)
MRAGRIIARREPEMAPMRAMRAPRFGTRAAASQVARTSTTRKSFWLRGMAGGRAGVVEAVEALLVLLALDLDEAREDGLGDVSTVWYLCCWRSCESATCWEEGRMLFSPDECACPAPPCGCKGDIVKSPLLVGPLPTTNSSTPSPSPWRSLSRPRLWPREVRLWVSSVSPSYSGRRESSSFVSSSPCSGALTARSLSSKASPISVCVSSSETHPASGSPFDSGCSNSASLGESDEPVEEASPGTGAKPFLRLDKAEEDGPTGISAPGAPAPGDSPECTSLVRKPSRSSSSSTAGKSWTGKVKITATMTIQLEAAKIGPPTREESSAVMDPAFTWGHAR